MLAMYLSDNPRIVHGHTTGTLTVFPLPSPCKRDGQFTDALKIMLVTCTVRQAHRIEDPKSFYLTWLLERLRSVRLKPERKELLSQIYEKI